MEKKICLTQCGWKVVAAVSYFSCVKFYSQNPGDPWKLYRPEGVIYHPHIQKCVFTGLLNMQLLFKGF